MCQVFFPWSKNTGFLCCSVSSTPTYTFGGQTSQHNTNSICSHLLFVQSGTAGRVAPTQPKYDEFNRGPHKTDHPMSAHSWAAVRYGLQGVSVTDSVNAPIFSGNITPNSWREIKLSGMLRQAILQPTRSESDKVTVSKKLASVSVTQTCVLLSPLTWQWRLISWILAVGFMVLYDIMTVYWATSHCHEIIWLFWHEIWFVWEY